MKRIADAALMAAGFAIACGLAVGMVAVAAWGWAVDVLDD